MVNGLYLHSAFLVFFNHSKHFYTSHIHPFIHIHTLMIGDRIGFGVKYLAQGHTDMWTGGAGNRTAKHPVGGRLPTEPQLPV